MIWVRSCGKIHEFKNAIEWRTPSGGGITIYDESLSCLAQFESFDWVRRADAGTELLDDTTLRMDDEPESTDGASFAECGRGGTLEC